MRAAPLLAAAAVASGAAAPATAQLDRWHLPPRGAAEYERIVHDSYVAAPAADPRRGIQRVVAPGAEAGHEWRYTTATAAEGFADPGFDDAGWPLGRTPFGDGAQRTSWASHAPVLCARGRFALSRRMPKAAVLTVDHDDVATVWLNGVRIYHGGGVAHGVTIALDEAALEAFVAGTNVVAARVENTGGAAFFDLGLTLCDRAYREPEAAIRIVREDVDQARRTSASLLPGFRAPRFLCEGELDAARLRLARTPIDLRDLPFFVACDLARADSAGPLAGTARRTYRFGDVAWRGKAAAPDHNGVQRIELVLESAAPAYGDDDRRYVDAIPRGPHAYTHSLRGSLVLERCFDRERSALGWFRARIEAEIAPLRGEGAEQHYVYDEERRLLRIRENRDPEFQAAVVAAIRKGAKRLEAELRNPDRGVLRDATDGDRSYNSGRLALALLALLHADTPRDSAIVQRALAELRERRLVDTYSTAHAIMALECYYAPRGELEDLRNGTIDRPRRRRPSDEDLALLEEWTAILLGNVDTRVDPGYLLRFNYTPGPRYDNSVNQYGLLGLYSAHLCGVKVPATVWEAAANHLIDDQQRPGRSVELRLTTHREARRAASETATTTGTRHVKAAGWGYHSPESNGVPQPVYGSMTCAGIAGLTICLAGLRDLGLVRNQLAGAADRAILQGFAWLAEHFTVHASAGREQQPYYWVYYYLYGLERACELSGVAWINGRDWYQEGALTLLDAQLADGGWPDDQHPDHVLERTAMAILFLKKASMPVFTK